MLLFDLQLFAHKKGVSSTKNGRDSNAQRLGTKMHAGQIAKPGNIIVRQRGTHLHPGLNVKIGKDDTLFAVAEGRVAFQRLGRDKRQFSVYPVGEYTKHKELYSKEYGFFILKNQGRNSGYGFMKINRKDAVRKQTLFLMSAAKLAKGLVDI